MYTRENTKFSIDWLNVRLDVKDLSAFYDDLCTSFRSEQGETPLTRDMIQARPTGGVCFYTFADYIPQCGYSSVLFAFNLDEHKNIINEGKKGQPFGVLVSVSGDGCRWLNSLIPNGMYIFCSILNKYNPVCTRIDMACDFLEYSPVVDMIQLYGMTCYTPEDMTVDLNCGLVRKNGFCQINMVFDPDEKKYTPNVTIGGRSSSKGTLQLYNKKVEVLTGRLSGISELYFKEYGVTDYWWRLEYRCKSFADKVFKFLMANNVEQAFLFAMSEFGDFIVKKYDDHNRNKCPVTVDWQTFSDWILSLANDIHLVEFVSTPYVSPSVPNLMRYMNNNSALIYQIALIQMYCPDFWANVVAKGNYRFDVVPRYAIFRSQIQDYIFSGEFPKFNEKLDV